MPLRKILLEGLQDLFSLLKSLLQIFWRADEVKDAPMNREETVKPLPEPQNSPTTNEKPEVLLWDTPKHTWHSVRVMCDNAGLSFTQKNIICACIWQESNFYNYLPNGKPVRGDNIRNGVVTSSDWGLIQVNDTKGWHIGPGLRYSSVQDVLDHPERGVAWMIQTMKTTGRLQPWASYTSGAYKKHLPLNSKMWTLAEK